jgi:hypothetical protein
VADSAEGFTDENDNPAPPPPELSIAFQVDQWGADAVYGHPLPAKLLRRMTACLNVYQAIKSYQAGSYRLADWARAHPQQAQIVTQIREMRAQNDR